MNYAFGGGNKKVISGFERIQRTTHNDIAERTCLMCEKKFVSTHKAHRRCGRCDYLLIDNCKDKGLTEKKVVFARPGRLGRRYE